MKRIYLFVVFLFVSAMVYAQTAKIIGECTVMYTIKIANTTGDASKILYIKGKKTRAEIVSPSFIQTTIYDDNTGEAVILRELSGEKYVTKLNAAKWKEQNKEWEGMTVKHVNENKLILGYPCLKAVATTKNGKNFILYYTTNLMPSASENPYQFKGIPGIVMEYESETNDGKSISFKATKINFNPVPAAKFIIPETGYRELK